VIDRKVAELKEGAIAELAKIAELGGAVAAIESGYMKQALVESNSKRLAAIELGTQPVVGVNCFMEGERSPLVAEGQGAILVPDAKAEREQIERLQAWREARDSKAAEAALAQLKAAAAEGRNVMEASIACAHAGVTTGEWGQALREIFGEYRAPTGVGETTKPSGADISTVAEMVEDVSRRLGCKLKMLVGKPGLDGHSNGAEQVAVKAREVGMDVVYDGIRRTPAELVQTALKEKVHVVGLSILSGSHMPLVTELVQRMRDAGLGHVPVVVGGIIPPDDEEALLKQGVARVYTPKDYQMTAIMEDLIRLLDRRNWYDAA
jgi:(2R)-ethylmalonyl-CoA mutase